MAVDFGPDGFDGFRVLLLDAELAVGAPVESIMRHARDDLRGEALHHLGVFVDQRLALGAVASTNSTFDSALT